MSYRWPFWLRCSVSVLVPFAVYMPFSRFTWWSFLVQGPSAATGGDPVYVMAPVAGISFIVVFVDRFGIAVGEAVVASSLAILIFTALTYLFGERKNHETRCRKCRQVLRGLTAPCCPRCGEPL